MQENLTQGLQVVSHLSNKNITLPILNNVLIKADNKELKLVTTNLEAAISCVVRAKIEEPGEFTVPAKLFADYIELVSPGRVDLELKGSDLIVRGSGEQSLIKGNLAADFPIIPQLDRQEKHGLPVEDFKKAMQQVLFAVSKSESRPELSGVFFSFNPEERAGFLVTAATDSFRLAEKESKLLPQRGEQKYSQTPKKAIVPAKAILELLRIISAYRSDLEEEAPLEIVLSENQILFCCGAIELTSRLVDGQYPNYKQIIPGSFKTTVNFRVSELIKRIKAASLFSSTGINGIALEFAAGHEQKTAISSLNSQVGENRSEVLCQINGEDNKILLNYRYLLDGLANMGSEEASLKVISGDTPCLLTGKEQAGYLYIVMPIKQ